MSEVAVLNCAKCGVERPETLLRDGLCNGCRVAVRAELKKQEEAAAAAETAKPRKSKRGAPDQVAIDAKAEAAKELARRELARRRYLPFVLRFNPDYQAGWMHQDIALRLEKFMRDVEDQLSPRLMIFCPPRHGKSQLTSKTYPSWVLGHHPTWEFMTCSYAGDLSMSFSRNVRNIMRDPSYQNVFKTRLDPDSQSVEQWLTTEGGGLVAAGVGGAITGKGAHILLIDDPVKNRENAESEQIRQVAWDWYTSTAYTRLAPGGGILVIQTRWHDDDLSGRLIRATAEGGDKWEIVSYPAIATSDEEFRAKGEPLHEARYPITALNRIRKAVGERDWWALYQQTPVADEGSYFTKDMFAFYRQQDLPPRDEMVFYTAWDLAIGLKEHNDYTVGFTVGIDRNEELWVVDMRRGRWDSLDICNEIVDTWQEWESHITGIEKGQIEMSIGPFLQRVIAEKNAWGLYTEPLKTGRRDKPARARPIQGMMRARKVHFPHPEDKPWVLEVQNEMLRFPSGTHDDIVDALAWIGQMIVEMAPSVPPPPPKAKSWRDNLDKFIRGGNAKNNWRAA